MINFKIIAVKIDLKNIAGLIKIVAERKDTKVPTGVKLTYTESYWQSDSSGYGGETVYSEYSIDEQRVVLNVSHNQERIRTLELLAQMGGPEVIKGLLGIKLEQSLTEYREHYSSSVEVVKDDRSFENLIENRRKEIIAGLIAKLSNEEIRNLFKGTFEELIKICNILNQDFHEVYVSALKRLADSYPEDIIKLYCKLMSKLNRSYQDLQRPKIERCEEFILDYLDAPLRDRARLSFVVELHHYLRDKGIREAVLKEIYKRMTIIEAIDIINKSEQVDQEVLQLILEIICKHDNSPEIEAGIASLNFVSFIDKLCRFVKKLTEKISRDIFARSELYEYGYDMINEAHLLAARKLAMESLNQLGVIHFITVYFSKFEDALRSILRDPKTKDIPSSILAVLDSIRSREIVPLLFLMSNELFERMKRSYQPQKLSEILASFRKQALLDEDLEGFKKIYMQLLKGGEYWGRSRVEMELVETAQFIEELEPGSVTKRRSLLEWISGQRPWATRKIRKGLKKLERGQQYIEDLLRIDSKVPYLFEERIRRGKYYGNVSREFAVTIVANLKNILRVITEEPSFDYYDMLMSSYVIEGAIKSDPKLALELLEALLNKELKDGRVHNRNVESYVDYITKLGDREGIIILQDAKRLVWTTSWGSWSSYGIDFYFWDKISAIRYIGRAIRQLEKGN